MKVGIFGSEYQIERQNLIKRLFEKLREQEADIYVDSPFKEQQHVLLRCGSWNKKSCWSI